jgi:hypothetical protein
MAHRLELAAVDGDRHSNVELVPGSFAHRFTWPPIEPPPADES